MIKINFFLKTLLLSAEKERFFFYTNFNLTKRELLQSEQLWCHLKSQSHAEPYPAQTEADREETNWPGWRVWCTCWAFLKTGEATHGANEVRDKGFRDGLLHAHAHTDAAAASVPITSPGNWHVFLHCMFVSSKLGYLCCQGCVCAWHQI